MGKWSIGRATRVLSAVVVFLLGGVVLFYGAAELWQAHANLIHHAVHAPTHPEMSYFAMATGGAMLYLALHGMWRGGRSYWLLLIAVGIFYFYSQVTCSQLRTSAWCADNETMRKLHSALIEWGERHGGYPMTDSQFRSVVSSPELANQLPPTWLHDYSPYVLDQNAAPYDLHVEKSFGPNLESYIFGRPGVICYTVSPDGRSFWLTMSTLQYDDASKAVQLEQSHGKPLVFHGQIPIALKYTPTLAPFTAS